MNTPFWISENDVIEILLNRFVDKLDQSHKTMMVRASEKALPSLFFNQEVDPDFLWENLVKTLSKEHDVIKEIVYEKHLALVDPYYKDAKIYFNTHSEDQVRLWLSRPKRKTYGDQWVQTLALLAEQLPNSQALINPIRSSDFTAQEILDGFVLVHRELTSTYNHKTTISLRTLSARCFFGDSKFLDQRRTLIEHAFPLAKNVLQPRAIMMSVYVPTTLRVAIFVENFDSFRSTVRAVKESQYADRIAVVYSAGYRGSAAMIRTPGNTQFVTINHATTVQYQAFSDWWFSDRQNIPVLFWGDLDFEGMGILKSLRGRFFNAITFKSAYEIVLNYHSKGVCHANQSSHKGDQIDPGISGCEYADHVLLPAIRLNQRFTDQEVLGENEILSAIEQQITELE